MLEENYKATSRNGHELKDMYNPETNTLDIRSNGAYPSNVLSNLCSNSFRFDGMICGSIEGFLQSLKRQDINKQRQICSMKGGNARKMSVTSWQTDQIVWWKGQAIDRQSDKYQDLIHRAYKANFCLIQLTTCCLLTRRRFSFRRLTCQFPLIVIILCCRIAYFVCVIQYSVNGTYNF